MTIPASTFIPYRRALEAAALLTLLAVALLAVAPAAAADSCGKKVVDDWYADGRVDGTYAPHCYDDAIEILPRDIKEYSSAPDDIERALQNRLNDKPAPPARTDPSPGEAPPTATTPTPTTRTPTTTGAGDEDPPESPTPGETNGPEAGPPLETADADAIPVPLLVLGGLALLLVAAGSAGYLTRRLQARRLPPPGA